MSFANAELYPFQKVEMNVNFTDPGNYRGISLRSTFGKMFDLLVLNICSDCFMVMQITVWF